VQPRFRATIPDQGPKITKNTTYTYHGKKVNRIINQNRRHKVLNRGLYLCAGGLYVRAEGLDIQI